MASWETLLEEKNTKVLPWLGGREVHSASRSWVIKGRLPREYGWYRFETTGGREATCQGPADRDMTYSEDRLPLLRGLLVGDRFISAEARVDPNPAKLIDQTEPVFCVDEGFDRFQRAVVLRDRVGRLLFHEVLFPEGPEGEVLNAYQDRKDSVHDIPGVTPPLELAFRWISYQRAAAEAREAEQRRLAAEEAAKAAEEERRRRLIQQTGTAEGRRALVAVDFNAAARAALRVSGAELLDVIQTRDRNEVRVQYRFRHRRLECVVNRTNLRIVDAGVCLDDHRGTKGDTLFTLESLPGVIGEALDMHKLVVWRHVPGDVADRGDHRDDDDDDD